MASQCPKCHQPVDEDYICCAGVEFQWKCVSCHKRTRGFAFPFGRCSLCDGELVRLKEEGELHDERLLALQEAFQIEVSAYHFYHKLAAAVDDPQTGDFFESLSEMEKGHALELSEKYHMHLGESDLFKDLNRPLPRPFFDDLKGFADTGDLRKLYDGALTLEKRTLDYFQKKAATMAEGKERELYLELAAEENEHITLLESEKDRARGEVIP